MAWSELAPCLTTPEQVLVSGANGACGEAHGDRAAGGAASFVLFGVIALLAAAAFSRRPIGRAFAVVFACAAGLAASIGWWTVLAVRADAPLRAAATAAHIEGLADRLDAFAWARSECVETVHNACVACEPLVRFALPAHVSCTHAHGRVELRQGALSGACIQRGDALDCGTSGSSAL